MTANRTRLSVTALEARDCPASLLSVAQSLVTHTVADAKQLVADVATVEYYRPTVARAAITNDLVSLNNAANAHNVNAIFVGTARLLTDLQAEAKLITAYHLNQTSPLAYKAVTADFARLVVDRVAELQLIAAAAQQVQAAQRTQVQQQLQVPSISTSLASIQASQRKISQLTNLENAYSSYYNDAWVNSFSSSTG